MRRIFRIRIQTKSPFIEFLVSKTSEHNLFIVSGFNERDKDLLYNSAVLVGPKGVVGKYRKLHLFTNEIVNGFFCLTQTAMKHMFTIQVNRFYSTLYRIENRLETV